MFVFPSLYEGFGLPVLEAMKCGCPVITTNLTSIPEVISDCGILIDMENNPKEQFVEAISKIYSDENFREDCSKKGLERAKLFSWTKCTRIIVEKIKKDIYCKNKEIISKI